MMMHAYDEVFLDDAMENLGCALEYGVIMSQIEGQEFLECFIASGLAKEFGKGNVKYISGMSGIELSRLIMHECGISPPKSTELVNAEYPAEYWIGWILAYYQWYSGKSFEIICKKLKYSDMKDLYATLHEADQSKAAAVLDEIIKNVGETSLAIHRKNLGLSQRELAERAGVSIRTIQLFEQSRNDVNRATYQTLASIARVLGCEIEDLLD